MISENQADYRALLIKYIDHIKNCESIDFIHYTDHRIPSEAFTPDEIELLKRLSKEGEK